MADAATMAGTADAVRRALRGLGLGLAAVVLAGCSELGGAPPAPTPQDFPSIAAELQLEGLTVDRVVSGDTGCNVPALVPTAIAFDVSGLGVTDPLRARVFLFADDAAYQRRRSDVDSCTAAWATDPADIEFVDASPFVLVIQGPLPAAFKAALVHAITTAAGRGS